MLIEVVECEDTVDRMTSRMLKSHLTLIKRFLQAKQSELRVSEIGDPHELDQEMNWICIP